MKKVLGVLFYLSYKLENHYLFQISLKNWLWLLIVVPPAAAIWQLLTWASAVLLALLGGVMLVGIGWARKRDYLIFEPISPGQEDQWSQPPFRVDEPTAGRAFGALGVDDKEKRLAGEAAWLSFVRSREHVVMARVRRTRFLLLARSLQGEAGWWYAFWSPHQVQEVRTGSLTSGIKTRPGLKVSYQTEESSGRQRSVYLTFDDVKTVQKVVANLRIDVPAQAFAAGEESQSSVQDCLGRRCA